MKNEEMMMPFKIYKQRQRQGTQTTATTTPYLQCFEVQGSISMAD